MNRRARVLVANLHATSLPWLVIPWLWALCAALRVDAVLLSECTPRHARFLRRRSRRWQLIADGPEAIYVRRGRATRAQVGEPITRPWQGRHTGDMHPGRTLPRCTLDDWLDLHSVHLPPGWIDGALDRVAAGRDWLVRARTYSRRAQLWAGDWQYRPTAQQLVAWRGRRGLYADDVEAIDHYATKGCTVTRYRRLRRGPGMDHRPFVVDVEDEL